MDWGAQIGRRSALLLGLLSLVLFSYVAVAILVVRDDGNTTAAAQPLHPVATTFVADDTQLLECSEEPCFQQAFGNVAFREGARAALSLVDDVYESGSAACHRVVHTIGAAALTRNRGNLSRTFTQGSSICWSGYYHGVLEYSLLGVKSSRSSALGPVARTLCRDAMDHMTGWMAWQCLHGLGHGLMITTGLDLPRSLGLCKGLATWWERDVCKSGAFMENVQPSLGLPSRWQREDDPVYPCNAVAREDKPRCYQMVTTRILPAVDDDWERTAEMCSALDGFAGVCFGSLGRDASARSNRDPDEIARICAVARRYGGERGCVTAAAMDMTANFSSGSRAQPLCVVVADRIRDDCYFGVGVVMSLFRKTEAARVSDCRALVVDPRLVAACLRGGRSTSSRI